ncbi:transcription factor [Sphingomonas sp. UV9]|uniref:type II toxin-antitoxin system VapB family antitoxin n=1 Tax=Sphingomonas sp. UV9 TaxID=1851410 RepID=UPI000FFB5BD9|nr:type II toxin-antitoxin system VapB family antitoxin [Sphingomonas sp. UV9]RXD05297.1 transcription factor [Sphingomonas sp. UV9]
MASLYIKDSETAELASELASRLGVTKTEIVRDLLRRRKAELEPESPVASLRERMRQWRAAHPLGQPTGFVADKAFYDSLNDEDDD